MSGKLELHMNAEAAVALTEALRNSDPLILTALHGNKVIQFHLGAYQMTVTQNSPAEMMRSRYGQECTVTLGVQQLIPAIFSDEPGKAEDDDNHVRDAVRANR